LIGTNKGGKGRREIRRKKREEERGREREECKEGVSE
jgi:hypothetical protein